MVVIETYYSTNTYTSSWPEEFVNATGERLVQVVHCACTLNGYVIGDVMMHADFVQRDAYLDHYVGICNIINSAIDTDTYSYTGNSPTFRVWFTTLNGEEAEIDAFVLKLLLTYDVPATKTGTEGRIRLKHNYCKCSLCRHGIGNACNLVGCA